MTNMEYNIAAALAGIAAGLAIYLIFLRPKTDPKVKELANLAWAHAARIMEIRPKGSPPPVGLRDVLWKKGTATVIGNYKWYGFPGFVLWDRILVVENRANIYFVLIHEMAHALRRRTGKRSSEAAADAVAATAVKQGAGPEVDALLEKL